VDEQDRRALPDLFVIELHLIGRGHVGHFELPCFLLAPFVPAQAGTNGIPRTGRDTLSAPTASRRAYRALPW
jgi:hypothetical protein